MKHYIPLLVYNKIIFIFSILNIFQNFEKILFLAHHRIDRSPGQRYRFEQFFDYLEIKGFQCYLANIINEHDENALYHSKNILKKIKIGLNSYKRRWIHISKIQNFDLIVIYREVLPTKSIYFENYILRKKFQLSMILMMLYGLRMFQMPIKKYLF